MVLSNSTSGTDATTSQKGQYELSTEELARGAQMVFHLRDGLSSFDRSHKPRIAPQQFHAHNFSLGANPPQSRSSGRQETEGRIGDTFALSNGAFGNCESTAWRDPAVDETEQQISKEHGTDGRAHPCQIALEGHLHPVVKRISPETPVRSETAVQA